MNDDIARLNRNIQKLDETTKKVASEKQARAEQEAADAERRHSESMDVMAHLEHQQRLAAQSSESMFKMQGILAERQMQFQTMLATEQRKREEMRLQLDRAAKDVIRNALHSRDQHFPQLDRDGIPDDDMEAITLLLSFIERLNVGDAVLQRADDLTPVAGEFLRESPSVLCRRMRDKYLQIYLAAAGRLLEAKAAEIEAVANHYIPATPPSHASVLMVLQHYWRLYGLREVALSKYVIPFFDAQAFENRKIVVANRILEAIPTACLTACKAMSEAKQIKDSEARTAHLMTSIGGDIRGIMLCYMASTLPWPAPCIEVADDDMRLTYGNQQERNVPSYASEAWPWVVALGAGVFGFLGHTIRTALPEAMGSFAAVLGAVLGLCLMLAVGAAGRNWSQARQLARIKRLRSRYAHEFKEWVDGLKRNRSQWWKKSLPSRQKILNTFICTFPAIGRELKKASDQFCSGNPRYDMLPADLVAEGTFPSAYQQLQARVPIISAACEILKLSPPTMALECAIPVDPVQPATYLPVNEHQPVLTAYQKPFSPALLYGTIGVLVLLTVWAAAGKEQILHMLDGSRQKEDASIEARAADAAKQIRADAGVQSTEKRRTELTVTPADLKAQREAQEFLLDVVGFSGRLAAEWDRERFAPLAQTLHYDSTHLVDVVLEPTTTDIKRLLGHVTMGFPGAKQWEYDIVGEFRDEGFVSSLVLWDSQSPTPGASPTATFEFRLKRGDKDHLFGTFHHNGQTVSANMAIRHR